MKDFNEELGKYARKKEEFIKDMKEQLSAFLKLKEMNVSIQKYEQAKMKIVEIVAKFYQETHDFAYAWGSNHSHLKENLWGHLEKFNLMNVNHIKKMLDRDDDEEIRNVIKYALVPVDPTKDVIISYEHN